MGGENQAAGDEAPGRAASAVVSTAITAHPEHTSCPGRYYLRVGAPAPPCFSHVASASAVGSSIIEA